MRNVIGSIGSRKVAGYMSDYWSTVLDQRIGRRRALAATGGAAAAAAFLAACGGDDSGGGQANDSSGLVVKPVDSTTQAQRGGTLKWYAPAEPANLDVQVDQAPKNVLKNMTYGHFVNEKAGVLGPPAYEEYVPDGNDESYRVVAQRPLHPTTSTLISR